MSSAEVCVLKTDGINCDMEMAYAFEVVGASAEIVHINQLRDKTRSLSSYGALAIPGGFSYGDDIASGKILANEMTSFLSDELSQFVEDDRPVIGVCNGFQVLVRTGLLPNRTLGEQQATLTDNDIARFECRWIDLSVGQSACRFVKPEDFEEHPLPMQIAHGEGKFYAEPEHITDLLNNQQVVFSYSTSNGQPPEGYPDNPNGSLADIAGICDPSGLILGMMPHPERSIRAFHPDESKKEVARVAAHTIFANITRYIRES